MEKIDSTYQHRKEHWMSISMPVEDVFSIKAEARWRLKNRARTIKVGENVNLVGIAPTKKTTVTGVEMFKKQLNEGQAGDNAGLLLRGVKRKF